MDRWIGLFFTTDRSPDRCPDRWIGEGIPVLWIGRRGGGGRKPFVTDFQRSASFACRWGQPQAVGEGHMARRQRSV